MKNLLTIGLTAVGLIDTTYSAPIIMAYMTLTEIEVMKGIIKIVAGRIKLILAVFMLVGILAYYISYAIFMQHKCEDMLLCF
jgi:hypothetical protein